MLWNAIAKALDPRGWIGASSRAYELRNGGVKAPPFTQSAGVRYYSSWIYAAATINANAVASTPLRLYVRSSPTTRAMWNTRKATRRAKAWLSGDGERNPSAYVMRKAAELGADFEEVTDDHPLLRLLSTANPWFNGYDATVLRVVWQELAGNAYQHVVYGPLGTPVELWPMPPQWTTIVTDAERFIGGYLYGASEEGKQRFTVDEVIHFRRPNPRDLWYGMGKLEAAWGAANANVALHEMDLSLFGNNARPDYLLTIKGNPSSDELDRIEKSLKGRFRGTKKAGQFMVASADIDLKPLQFAPKDIAGRDDVVEEIAAIFGVPVSMLKANDPNLAAATTGFATWREMTVLPLCRMDEETLNQRLLPMFGIEGDAVLAYDDPVPANRAQDLTETQTAVAGGWLTPNEARARVGLEPHDDPMADRLLVNGIPLGGPPAAAPLLASVESPSDARTPVASIAALPAPVATDAATPETKADCVSDKIRTLLGEGYDREQAIAIAISMCGKSAGKALEDIDTVPPQVVADNARRALDVRESKPPSQRGMTATGIARARDLANRVAVSEDTIRRMVAYFERHVGDKSGATWSEQGKGWQAWHGWGGDEGWEWAKRKRDEFDRERGTKSAPTGSDCGCGSHAKSVTQTDLWSMPGVHTKAAGDPSDDALERFLASVDSVLRAQIRDVVAQVRRESDPTADGIARAVAVIERTKWQREIVDALAPYIEEALRRGADVGFANLAKIAGSPAVAEIGFTSRELSEYVQRASVRLATDAANSINEYTAVRVREIFQSGLEDGDDVDQLADRVQEWAKGEGDDERATRRRATMIARTEAARAAVTAEQDAWKSTGIVEGKSWLLAPDPCEFCEAVAKQFGKTGVGLEDSFYPKGASVAGADGGTLKLNYSAVDGPPLHPNCRCALQPKLADGYQDIVDEAARRIRAQEGTTNEP